MTVTLRDAIIFFYVYGNPVIGTVQIETPLKPNTTLNIKVGNQTFTTLIKQIDLLIFKINSKTFGIVSNNTFSIDDDVEYWDEYTENEAGRELHECFANLSERSNKNDGNN